MTDNLSAESQSAVGGSDERRSAEDSLRRFQRQSIDSTFSDGPPDHLPPGTWDAHVHISCPRCHHYHNKAPVTISRQPRVYNGVSCSKCGHHLMGFGRTSTRTSLMSQETISTTSLNNYRSGLPSLTICTNSQKDWPGLARSLQGSNAVLSGVGSARMQPIAEGNSPASAQPSHLTHQIPSRQPSHRSNQLAVQEKPARNSEGSSNTPLNGSQHPDGESATKGTMSLVGQLRRLHKRWGDRARKLRNRFSKDSRNAPPQVVIDPQHLSSVLATGANNPLSTVETTSASPPPFPSSLQNQDAVTHTASPHVGLENADAPVDGSDRRPVAAANTTTSTTGTATPATGVAQNASYTQLGCNPVVQSERHDDLRAQQTRTRTAQLPLCLCAEDCPHCCPRPTSSQIPEDSLDHVHTGDPRPEPTVPVINSQDNQSHSREAEIRHIGAVFDHLYPLDLAISDTDSHRSNQMYHAFTRQSDDMSRCSTLYGSSSGVNGSNASGLPLSSSIPPSTRPVSMISTMSHTSAPGPPLSPAPYHTARPMSLPPLTIRTENLVDRENSPHVNGTIDEEHTPTGPRAQVGALSQAQHVHDIEDDHTPTTAVRDDATQFPSVPLQSSSSIGNLSVVVDLDAQSTTDDVDSTAAHLGEDHSPRASTDGAQEQELRQSTPHATRTSDYNATYHS